MPSCIKTTRRREDRCTLNENGESGTLNLMGLEYLSFLLLFSPGLFVNALHDPGSPVCLFFNLLIHTITIYT